MTTFNLRNFFMIVALVFTSSAAYAQTYGNFTVFAEQRAILLHGPIERDSPAHFRKALSKLTDVQSIVLRSPGGVVVAALEIAAEINSRDLLTLVEDGHVCASACSILFFSGKQRVALGQLGVHQMSASKGGSLSGVQFLLADVLSAFDHFGVDDRVLQKMLRTSPDDMYFFSTEQKSTWHIDRFTKSDIGTTYASFSAYRPNQYHSGPIRQPDFLGRDEWAKTFKTRIIKGLNGGSNFAGHYSLIEIGCGSHCRFAFVVDSFSGEVFRFPYGGEEQYQLGLVYSLDSRLVRATWSIIGAGSEATCISQDLLWSENKFELVNEVTFEADQQGICSISY